MAKQDLTPSSFEETYALLDLHARFIRTPEFNGVWVLETDRLGNLPRVITAMAAGPYVVSGS